MKKKLFTGSMREFAMLVVLVCIIIYFYFFTQGKILNPMNISNLINQNAYVVILAIGMLLCILTGGNIDLSVGSVVAIVGACCAIFIIEWQWNVYLSVALCLLLGTLLGAWQGFWIAYMKIPPFITTLSGMLVFRGATLLILKGGETIGPFPQAYQNLFTGFLPDIGEGITLFGSELNLLAVLVGAAIVAAFCAVQVAGHMKRRRSGYETYSPLAQTVKLLLISAFVVYLFYKLACFKGIPTVLVLLGVLLLVYSFFTQKTVPGRHLYAIGGNMKAARLSGVKTEQMLFFAYTNMGFLAAVAGLVFAARLNSASPVAGQSFEMDAIASCFIGGASAYGGTGTIGGALIGAMIMGVLNNGMSLMGLSQNLQHVVKGLVLLLAVAFDVMSKGNVTMALPKLRKKSEPT
ncbi:MAG: sugar ABC transporter permease [Eubacteriales bacterium]|nr:sugar ABC transporter permease [Eubacteriales bacterium]